MLDDSMSDSEWIEQVRERARAADVAGKARTAERKRRSADAVAFIHQVYEDFDQVKDAFNLFEGVEVEPQVMQLQLEFDLAVRRKFPPPPRDGMGFVGTRQVRDQFVILEYRITARRDGDRYLVESSTGHPDSRRLLGTLEDELVTSSSPRKSLEFKPAPGFTSFRDDASSRWIEAMEAIDPAV